MEIKEYVLRKKELYCHFLDFIENEDSSLNNDKIFKFENIKESRKIDDQKALFHIILNVSNNHYRDSLFKSKIAKIIDFFSDTFKQTFSNLEIFEFFKSNKQIILYLLKNHAISIDKDIFESIKNMPTSYRLFFYPEIKFFMDSDEIKENEEELLSISEFIFDRYEENRDIGENDHFICSLIRDDNIEEFIIYTNQKNISLSSRIKQSIFETNSFLMDKEPTLLEYAAFFGSIQIFQYLMINNAETTGELWLYAIHSNNAEIINMLENSHIELDDGTYRKCVEEAIKCHHNNIANYLIDNFSVNKNEKYFKASIKYYNYSLFPDISELSSFFYYLYVNEHSAITDYLIKQKISSDSIFKKQGDLENDETIIQILNDGIDNENDNTLTIYCLLLNFKQIKELYFKGNNKLKQLVIPSTIALIDDKSFHNCPSLTHVSIPSTVISIGKSTFSMCTSLKKVKIEKHSNLSSIGNYAFTGCKSLKQMIIPSSVSEIGYTVFSGCKSLKTIEIYSSLTSIKDYLFRGCSSLKKIIIPSSVTNIGNFSFRECSSLREIKIPSSVISIYNYAFAGCHSLKQIKIPSSVTTIGYNAFESCLSLTQILIPSSITIIDHNVFQNCQSLEEIKIPTSVTSIGSYAFQGCKSLSNILIPASVTSVGYNAFEGCSSLAKMIIPSKINIKTIGIKSTTKIEYIDEKSKNGI